MTSANIPVRSWRMAVTVPVVFLATAVVVPFGLVGGQWLATSVTAGQKRFIELAAWVVAMLIGLAAWVRHIRRERRGWLRTESVPGVVAGANVAAEVPELASTAA